MRVLTNVVIAITLLASSWSAAPLHAQPRSATPVVAPGTRVRITTRDHGTHTGVLVALTADSGMSARIAGPRDTMSLSDVTKLEVSQRGSRHIWRGLVLGTVAGTSAGFVLYQRDQRAADARAAEARTRLANECKDIEVPAFCLLAGIGIEIGTITTPEKVLYGGVAGAIAGTALGFIRREHWRAAPLHPGEHRVGLLLPADAHRVGVGLSASF